MAADSVEIANSALTIVGSGKIVALSDPSIEGRECNANYDSSRKAVLRDYPWNFASKRVVLSTPDATAPLFGYARRFPLPADFIRVHTTFDASGVRMAPDSYAIEEAFIITDEPTIWLKYVFNITDTTKFDALFDQALAAYLAHKISYKLSGSESSRAAIKMIYKEAIQAAKFVDTVEEPSQIIDSDEWIRARQGRGSFVRDPMT